MLLLSFRFDHKMFKGCNVILEVNERATILYGRYIKAKKGVWTSGRSIPVQNFFLSVPGGHSAFDTKCISYPARLSWARVIQTNAGAKSVHVSKMWSPAVSALSRTCYSRSRRAAATQARNTFSLLWAFTSRFHF